MATLDDAFQLLIAERDALVRSFEQLSRVRGLPEREIPARLMYACLALGAEAWRRVHPELDEEAAAQLFGEMAAEAVRAFNDARMVMAARRTLQEGAKDHA